ncbi:hypothetical protein F2Q70_00022191, partial [Brassica cretica]
DCNKGVLSSHVFGSEVRSCFSISNQTNLKEGGGLMGLTCSYLMKRVSPDRYRFIRPESGLELSQRRDRNLALTGVTWQDAGKVELVDGSSYLAQPLPFSISTLIRIKVLVTGYIEFQHNAELYSEAFVPINVVLFNRQPNQSQRGRRAHGVDMLLLDEKRSFFEWLTGVTWQDAGKVELVDGSSYLAQPLPFSIWTLIRIKVLVTGYIEFQHNAELDSEAVSPAQYRFIRPESGLELSQRRDRNLYGSGVPKSTPFQPYSERSFFKWLTGVTWKDAGKVELVDGSSYLAQPLPFSISTLIRINVLVTGYIEFQHNAELDSEAFVPINVV